VPYLPVYLGFRLLRAIFALEMFFTLRLKGAAVPARAAVPTQADLYRAAAARTGLIPVARIRSVLQASLIVAVASLGLIVAAGAGYALGRSDGGGEPPGPAQAAPLAQAAGAERSPAPTRTPAPTQTPAPAGTEAPLDTQAQSVTIADRVTCAEIDGTAYRSATEREFFLAECVPAAGSTPTSLASPTPAPVDTRFSWGENEGEYVAYSTTACLTGTVGLTQNGPYAGRSFCSPEVVLGAPPYPCPLGAFAWMQNVATATAVVGEVFCIAGTPPP
jgi:hypothetical protein